VTTVSAAKPTVVDFSVDTLTATSVTFVGHVNPNGLATTANYAYGLTSSLGQGTANQSLGSGSSAVVVNGTITGLQPSTTYYFRLQASNSGGGTYPAAITFTTPAS
jgi:hypothetical protein